MASKTVDKIDMSLDEIIKLNRNKKIVSIKPGQNKNKLNNRFRVQNKIKDFRSKFAGKKSVSQNKGQKPFNKANLKKNLPKKNPVQTNAKNQNNSSKIFRRPNFRQKGLQTRKFQQLKSNSFQQRRSLAVSFQRQQARQNVINKKRGIQTSKVAKTVRSFGFMRSDLIETKTNQQRRNKTRRWTSKFGPSNSTESSSLGILTISVPNNLQKKRPRINRKFTQQVVVNNFTKTNSDYGKPNTPLGQTSLSLHDRFSSTSTSKRIVFM